MMTLKNMNFQKLINDLKENNKKFIYIYIYKGFIDMRNCNNNK